jgi:hypothetical protein
MSKFPFPVIASKPLCFLKFDFLGKLLDSKLLNFEFVTQGGFPKTKISPLVLLTRELKLKSKTLK